MCPRLHHTSYLYAHSSMGSQEHTLIQQTNLKVPGTMLRTHTKMSISYHCISSSITPLMGMELYWYKMLIAA